MSVYFLMGHSFICVWVRMFRAISIFIISLLCITFILWLNTRHILLLHLFGVVWMTRNIITFSLIKVNLTAVLRIVIVFRLVLFILILSVIGYLTMQRRRRRLILLQAIFFCFTVYFARLFNVAITRRHLVLMIIVLLVWFIEISCFLWIVVRIQIISEVLIRLLFIMLRRFV